MTFLRPVAAAAQHATDAKNRSYAQPGNRPQQPAQVVARSTADRVQGITERALEPTAIHAVIQLQVADGGLHC